jgi:hypothetical protein
MKTMKRVYKKSDMVVWKDEKDNKNICYFYSIGGYDWIAVEAMNKTENELGRFSSKYKAFKALQSHMEKLGYIIEL